MKEIIIIHHEPLTIKIKKNFYVDELISKGFVVKYWDINKLLFKQAIILNDQIIADYYTCFNDYWAFDNAVRLNAENIFITEYAHALQSFKVDKILCKYKCIRVEMGIHTSVNLSTKEKLLNFRKYGFKLSTVIKKIYSKVIYSILNKVYSISTTPYAFFYCGSESKKQHNNSNYLVPINSFDFEDFRGSQDDKCKSKYIAFIDQFVPYHPDNIAYGTYAVDPIKYYDGLNNLFEIVEKEYKMEVVILAHPKASYDDTVFKGRKVIKYKTAEYVRNAEIVLCHDSLALSFGVLNYKPIFFLYLDEFYHTGNTTMILIEKFSKLLERPRINIEYPEDYRLIKKRDVNRKAYDTYKYNYLTSKESEKLDNIDIISSFLYSL